MKLSKGFANYRHDYNKILKGILPDVEKRVLSKFSKFECFAYFCRSPLRSTLPQGIRLKSFQYERRAIFTEVSYTRLYSTQ